MVKKEWVIERKKGYEGKDRGKGRFSHYRIMIFSKEESKRSDN